jgi:hypothetical protein
MLKMMDQNNGGTPTPGVPNPRQSTPASFARQSFAVPTNRPFAAPVRPVAPQPAATQPQLSPSAPQSVTFNPQQFRAPAQPVPAVPYQAPAAPLSFQPKPTVKKKRQLPKPQLRLAAGARWAKTLPVKAQIFSAVAVLVVISGASYGYHVATYKGPQLGVKAHGRIVAVGKPTLSDHLLESSCYTISLPAQYTLTHADGCVNQINKPSGSNTSLISVDGNPTTAAFALKDAPTFIRSQLQTIGIVKQYDTEKTTVDGLGALKVTYKLSSGPAQVLIYIPSPPAKYVAAKQPIGAFMFRSYYDTDAQKSNFDNTVASLKWVR